MLPPKRHYTREEFREILTKLYGHSNDWNLSGRAAADFNVSQLTVYRWLRSAKGVTGTAAAVAYLLSGGTFPDKT